MKTKNYAMVVLLFLGVAACQNEETPMPQAERSPMDQRMNKIEVDIETQENARMAGGVEAWMASVNEALAEHNLQLEKIEMLGADEAGNVIFFNNTGNKQLNSDFVPNDPRNGTGEDVPYIIDGTELGTTSGMTVTETQIAIDNAMNTWNNVNCSAGLDIPNWGVTQFDIGFIQFLTGFGGIAGFFPGVIVHAGILPPEFFDVIGGPGGGNGILGATFTFVWTDDLDNNGKSDVAIKEIYYNDGFNWQDAPDDQLFDGVIDFETVALHEAGHGLSQAHFGKLIGTTSNGMLHFAPGAVMNAGYTLARREVENTDLAGHCSNWEEWPNN